MALQEQLEGMGNVQQDGSGVVADRQGTGLPPHVVQVTRPLTYREADFDIPSILSPSSRQSQIINDIVQRHDVMNAVMSEIRRLKTSWYATLPISRIPPEILSAIFLLCARSAWAPFGGEVGRYGSPTMREAYSWLHIYSVCRHWRDVASACPALWAWVLPADAALVRLAFERSSGCPLTFETIHLRGSPNEGHALTRVFHSCWSRIERVELVVDSESLFANVDAPLLRSLRIWFNSSSTVSAQPLFKIHGTPNLSDLSWSNYMQWDLLHPLFNPRLESLRVQSVMAETPISAERWLDVLRNMPSLRRLYLDGVVSNFLKGEDVKDGPPISLPNLESFRISTAFVRFDDDRDSQIRAGDAYIFARLYIPTGASIKYNIHRGAMADIDLVHIARKVSAHVADKQHEWMKIHYKRRATTYSTTLIFETGHALTADKKPLVDDRICIGTRVDANVPLQIFAHVSLAGITEMQMDLQELSAEHTSIDRCNQMLRDLFRAAPHLRSLTLKGERALQSLPVALQPCVSQEGASVSSSCVLPDLQVLTLEDAIWHGPGLTEKLLVVYFANIAYKRIAARTERTVAPEEKPLLSTLVDILAARWAQGACLDTLRIRRGVELNADDVSYIRDKFCAHTVDWDGVTVQFQKHA